MSDKARDFRVLVIDDERLYAEAIAREVRRLGMGCDVVLTAADGLARSAAERYDLVLLDHKLPDDDGIRIIPIVLARQPHASLVMMTAYQAIPSAIQAIRQGADDYIVKQTSLQPIVAAVVEARRRIALRDASAGWWDEHEQGGLLGASPAIARVREQIARVASRSDTTVLLTGETGVGKEVAARMLHARSSPAGTPLVVVDCVALPGTLVESLLFGHEKGAFTGADRARNGAFHEAGEGTIFLDEIGEMDLALQGKLLRVIESRRFTRLGSVKEHDVRARVVAATNRDLLEQVKQGRFRFDLYQRLAVFPIHIPPLRDRGGDVLLLARHFLKFFADKMGLSHRPLSREVEEYLLSYDFPGNVRELKNVIERAAILSDDGEIAARHLPERILRRDAGGPPRVGPAAGLPFDFVPGVDTLDTLEVKVIRHALEQAQGVKAEAARILGISRFQLMRRLEKLRLDKGEEEERA